MQPPFHTSWAGLHGSAQKHSPWAAPPVQSRHGTDADDAEDAPHGPFVSSSRQGARYLACTGCTITCTQWLIIYIPHMRWPHEVARICTHCCLHCLLMDMSRCCSPRRLHPCNTHCCPKPPSMHRAERRLCHTSTMTALPGCALLSAPGLAQLRPGVGDAQGFALHGQRPEDRQVAPQQYFFKKIFFFFVDLPRSALRCFGRESQRDGHAQPGARGATVGTAWQPRRPATSGPTARPSAAAKHHSIALKHPHVYTCILYVFA